MYQYDPTIFDDMEIPEELDFDLLTDTIMLELAELGLIYADPDYMKFAIKRWSQRHLNKWKKLYATTVLDYNPIENYNRTEELTETNTKVIDGTDLETRDLERVNLETRDLESVNDETRNLSGSVVDSGSDINTKTVNAFNAATGVESGSDTLTHGLTQSSVDGGTVKRELADTGTINNKLDDEGTITNKTDLTETNTHTTTANNYGNIGVTTSQQMIEQERAILEFEMYVYITEEFKEQFCVRVWS